MPDTVPAAEVTDLIAAIRDALSPPEPAGNYQLREQLVTLRASYLTGVLAETAAGRPGDLTVTTGIVREIAARFPVRYHVVVEGDV